MPCPLGQMEKVRTRFLSLRQTSYRSSFGVVLLDPDGGRVCVRRRWPDRGRAAVTWGPARASRPIRRRHFFYRVLPGAAVAARAGETGRTGARAAWIVPRPRAEPPARRLGARFGTLDASGEARRTTGFGDRRGGGGPMDEPCSARWSHRYRGIARSSLLDDLTSGPRPWSSERRPTGLSRNRPNFLFKGTVPRSWTRLPRRFGERRFRIAVATHAVRTGPTPTPAIVRRSPRPSSRPIRCRSGRYLDRRTGRDLRRSLAGTSRRARPPGARPGPGSDGGHRVDSRHECPVTRQLDRRRVRDYE